MLLLLLLQVFAFAHTKDVTVNSSSEFSNSSENHGISEPVEKVNFQFLYETGCPYSIRKYEELEEVFKELGPYLNITTYPFGIAYFTLTDSQLTIECQHGERECHGNRLHACAIDALKEPSQYIPFNACMMRHKKKTHNASVDACGFHFNVTSESDGIKSCAKNIRGFQLLLNYGMESKKMDYPGVPWWFINDVPKRRKSNKTLKESLCAAFKNPPEVCKSSDSESESNSID